MFFFEVRLKPCVNSTDPFDTNATVCASPEDTTNWFIEKTLSYYSQTLILTLMTSTNPLSTLLMILSSNLFNLWTANTLFCISDKVLLTSTMNSFLSVMESIIHFSRSKERRMWFLM